MFRFVYTLIWFIALPFVVLRLMLKGKRDPRYWAHISERFGFYTRTPGAAPLIWIHAVSVGETRAAAPLIQTLLSRYPRHRILLTHMTPTGRETAEVLFADEMRVSSVYLPYDLPHLVARFFRHFKPLLGIIMETELWPNLVNGAINRAVPLALVNARLSERSQKRYAQYFPGLVSEMLREFVLVASQSKEDAQRLHALGALRPKVSGNLKFDTRPSAENLELGRTFLARLGTRRLILAASTREGEEALLLDAFLRETWPSDVLFGIVPRHPQRFEEVATLLTERKLVFQRRSDNRSIDPTTQVWLGDSMGELFAYYTAAQCALIGGSWLPMGGQNLIEAAAVGTPTLVGPHMFNFSEVARLAVEAGATLQLETPDAAMQAAQTILKEPEKRDTMRRAALRFSSEHTGASTRVVEWLEPFIRER